MKTALVSRIAFACWDSSLASFCNNNVSLLSHSSPTLTWIWGWPHPLELACPIRAILLLGIGWFSDNEHLIRDRPVGTEPGILAGDVGNRSSLTVGYLDMKVSFQPLVLLNDKYTSRVKPAEENRNKETERGRERAP